MLRSRARRTREFWDSRAAEDPFYFVDNRLTYRKPDLERFWRGGREDLDMILSRLGESISPADSIVEIGCGVGRLTRVLAERGRDVRALDVSARMLELARQQNPDLANVEWLPGDGTSLAGIADASADLCVSHVVFQHIPDPAVTLRYVREMGRVLRPEGRAVFQVSNAPELHRPPSLRERLRARLAQLRRRAPRGQAHPAWRGSAVDLHELRRAAATGGMELERVVGEGTQWCLVRLRRRDASVDRDATDA